ncbi:MAG: hypothetical protein AB1465_03530 [Patescibacteria group bacterium]
MKIILQCPKCKKKFIFELPPSALNPQTKETYQPLRCPTCGTFRPMKKK